MLRGIIAKSRINLSTMLQNGASMCMDSSSMIRIKSIDIGGIKSPRDVKNRRMWGREAPEGCKTDYIVQERKLKAPILRTVN